MIEREHKSTRNILEASVNPDGVVLLTLSGRITNAHLDEVVAWVEKVKVILQTEFEKKVDPILVMCDVSGISHFETKPVTAMRDLLSHDKQFPLVTAIVGPNNMIKMLVEALISLTRRTNIKQFPSEKEALEWLFENKNKAKSLSQ